MLVKPTRKEDGHLVTKAKQIGYVAKDMGMQHFSAPYLYGLNLAQLRQYGLENAQVRTHNVFKRRVMIRPASWAEMVAKYEQANLYPLCKHMDCIQVIRIMLMTDKYVLDPKWVAASGTSAFLLRAGNAFRKILCLSHQRKNIDIESIARAVGKGRDEPGTPFSSEYSKRNTAFDKMSPQGARKRAKRLYRIRSEAIAQQNGNNEQGLVDGDSDVDGSDSDLEMSQLGATDDSEDDADPETVDSDMDSDLLAGTGAENVENGENQ